MYVYFIKLGSQTAKEVDVVTVTSPIGSWTAVLKPRVWHFGRCHLGLLEPEVGREGGAVSLSA